MTEFTLHVSDMNHPYRRWQYIDSRAQFGDRVDVTFSDSSNYLHRIQGTYLGRAHSAQQSHSNPGSGGDNLNIVVIADQHYRWVNNGPTTEHRWGSPVGVAAMPYVLETSAIRTFETADGPTLFDAPSGIDHQALEQAIRDGLGAVSTDALVETIVQRYVEETS